MTVESVLDGMAEAFFLEWVERSRSPIGPIAALTAYDQLPDSERKARREAMQPVLTVVVQALDDEVLVAAMNAGDIAMHQAADLSQRFDEWLDNRGS